ncbi:hypothetical protein E1B28_013742 [Marasmius oreades]|uniref:Uncharacterized protein n=1 Tax=Marasmius oreades TaxID=181124 RepID=A0A9P7RR89_9AGAR|nr:uncharacterized protein E1B28_013742 [Marasmius oreades]KAG7087801.1 hypothetical protein E1B28_013742 [Marasmius oreades]
MSSPSPQDELTTTVFDAIQSLPTQRKANFLLDTALALIDEGQYGDQVETFLEVYLKTPNLDKADVARALLARGNARKDSGERLIAKAKLDFQAVIKLDPSNREVQSYLRRDKLIHFINEPASQRTPAEVWQRIAQHIPRYHLRTWLFVSAFHREIAMKKIFRTIDLYFGEDNDRGLDILDRAKADSKFAGLVKSLRLHWSIEEGDMLDLMIRTFRTALSVFRSLKDFEWIGYPELRADIVQSILSTHSDLHRLGLIGWHFDAVGVSKFRNLRKFTLRAEDDDGFADMEEIRTVLDVNAATLKHLILGAYLARNHSWDSAFQSPTISKLTHLDLVDTRISHIVLARIAHAHNLQSLTLHGTFDEPSSASVVFGSDHIIDGAHSFLPHLESFRFVMVGHDDEVGLYHSVTQFLMKRKKLRRLDLGSCPWELVLGILPDLLGLRVLGVRIANLNVGAVNNLVRAIPKQMVALNLSTAISEKPMNEYAPLFTCFYNLSFLHLQCSSTHRPKTNLIQSEKDFQVQSELWHASARSIACVVPSLDFIGWHKEHYVVVRGDTEALHPLSLSVELKELPSRRRLDCAKGVDLGTEDAAWLERKDVPIDYEVPVLE